MFCKGLTVDFEKSPGLGLFGKSGEKNNNAFALWLTLAGGSQVYLVDGKNELQALSDNVLQRASGVLILSMLAML